MKYLLIFCLFLAFAVLVGTGHPRAGLVAGAVGFLIGAAMSAAPSRQERDAQRHNTPTP